MEKANEFDANGWGMRRKKMSGEKRFLAMNLYFNEGLSIRDVADALEVSHMTVWRALSKITAEEVVGMPENYGYLALAVAGRSGR